MNQTKNHPKTQKATPWLFIAIIGVAFLLRVNQLNQQSLWRDEVDTILISSMPWQTLLRDMFATGHNGPLYFLLLRPWRALTNNSEFALRYPSAMAGTLLIPLGVLLVRRLGLGRRIAVMLSLLLATSPYLVWYGQEAKMYTMLTALIVLAVYAHHRALHSDRRRWWVIFVVVTSVSFYTHILAPLMLPVYALLALLHPTQLRRNQAAWLISMGSLTIPYLPLLAWQLPLLQTGLESGHRFYPLNEQLYLQLQLYSSGLLTRNSQILVPLFLFLGLCALFLSDPHNRISRRTRLLLFVWVSLPSLMLHAISHQVALFEDRYLIYIIPPLLLLIGSGLELLRQYSRMLSAFLLGLILLFNLTAVWHQQSRAYKADFRAAVSYMLRHDPPPTAVMIHIPYLQRTLNYYYPRDHYGYTLLEGLWTNHGQSEAEVNARMQALTHGLDELWLVLSEEELWDRRGLTQAWLEEQALVTAEAHFARVSVYRYRFIRSQIYLPLLRRPLVE